jgi:hypothetical protein
MARLRRLVYIATPASVVAFDIAVAPAPASRLRQRGMLDGSIGIQWSKNCLPSNYCR